MAAQPVDLPRAAPGPASTWASARATVTGCRRNVPAADARGWDAGERQRVLAEVDALVNELTVYRGAVLLAHREDGRWGTALDRDFADWRGRATRAGRGAAVGELDLAQGLQEMPGVGKAVEDGDVSLEHAKVLTRLRKDASPQVREALDTGVGQELIDLAKTLSAPELKKTATRKAAAIDAAAAQASFTAVHARRSFTSRRFAGGRKGEFFLTDPDGTTIDLAVDAIAGTPAAGDARTREQRRADALVIMANRVLQVGADRNGAQIRPHLALIVSEDTWAATVRHRGELDEALAAASPPPGTGEPGHSFYPGPGADGAGHGRPGCLAAASGPGTPPPGTTGAVTPVGALPPLGAVPALPDVAPAELEDGAIVPLGELARIACDCEMTRIVLSADSVALDVGQTQRHYTRELRRAITTRDRHCQWPECKIRASWSEVHHKRWFTNGGPTSIDNGLTLCSFHHHRVHDQFVRITPITGGHAFHDRHGQPLGETRWPERRRRIPAGTDDGLTPPRPGAAPARSGPPRPRSGALPGSPGCGNAPTSGRDAGDARAAPARAPTASPPPLGSDGTRTSAATLVTPGPEPGRTSDERTSSSAALWELPYVDDPSTPPF